jgi:ATP-dependent protease HslVU (ClpYQ) peptidase subunit
MKKSNTVLCVLRDPKTKKLVFASDRRVSWGMHKYQVTVRSKTTMRNNVIFAGTGVSYLCDLVGELSTIPDSTIKDPFMYMHTSFLPTLSKFLVEKGVLDKDKLTTKNSDMSAVILIGMGGTLFELDIGDHGLSMDPIDAPYAHGCGGQLALGAMKAMLEHTKFGTEKILREAIKVAASVSAGCDDNVDIVWEK